MRVSGQRLKFGRVNRRRVRACRFPEKMSCDELIGQGWKARSQKELALMADLLPLLHKLAQGREISGLQAYEQ